MRSNIEATSSIQPQNTSRESLCVTRLNAFMPSSLPRPGNVENSRKQRKTKNPSYDLVFRICGKFRGLHSSPPASWREVRLQRHVVGNTVAMGA